MSQPSSTIPTTNSDRPATIFLRCRDTSTGQRWEHEGSTIDLDSTYELFSAEVAFAAIEVRRALNKKLLIAKGQDIGMTMRATQIFVGARSRRTLHVNSFPRRFHTCKDMFTTKEITDATRLNHDMALNIDMELGYVELSRVPSPLIPDNREPPWLYHRIGTVPLQGERYDPQGSYAVLYRIDPDKKLPKRLMYVPERKHNGISIGDVNQPVLVDALHLEDSQRAELYRNLSEEDRERAVADRIEVIAQTRYQEDGIPQMPSMTYNDFSPTAAAKGNSTSDPITLDVHLYNKLHSLDHGDIRLPNSIMMEAYAGKGAKGTIVEDIGQCIYDKVGVLDAGKQQDDTSRAALLFGSELEGKWVIELWLRPQSRQLGKLYEYQEESLVWFLDPGLARQGKRLLYVEAHLVPKEM